MRNRLLTGGFLLTGTIAWSLAGPAAATDLPAPTTVYGTPADGSATVSWNPPTGAPRGTSYTVTALPGGGGCTTDGLTCTVPGLVNGISYRFTVAARTGSGTTLSSLPSNPVRPRVQPIGAPAAPHVPTTTGLLAPSPAAAQPATAQPATVQPAIAQPAIAQPAADQPASAPAAGPAALDPVIPAGSTVDPALAAAVLTDPALGIPALADPALGIPALADPAVTDPLVAAQPATAGAAATAPAVPVPPTGALTPTTLADPAASSPVGVLTWDASDGRLLLALAGVGVLAVLLIGGTAAARSGRRSDGYDGFDPADDDVHALLESAFRDEQDQQDARDRASAAQAAADAAAARRTTGRTRPAGRTAGVATSARTPVATRQPVRSSAGRTTAHPSAARPSAARTSAARAVGSTPVRAPVNSARPRTPTTRG